MVSMHANPAGLDLLIDSLQRLRQLVIDGKCEDIHLFAETSLGGELTITRLANTTNEVNNVRHLKLYGWTDEWAKRHNLLETRP